jgi:hypothetical protein
MYPTLLFGLIQVGVAARYAMSPEKRFVPLLVALGVLTMTAGALGFVTGFIVSVHAVAAHGATDPVLSLIGAGEALGNVALALFLEMLAALGAVLGAWKVSRASGARGAMSAI